jgi:hypothetical protein
MVLLLLLLLLLCYGSQHSQLHRKASMDCTVASMNFIFPGLLKPNSQQLAGAAAAA